MFGTSPKPLASLSSGLLARKGQAKPAMRPGGFGSLAGLTTGATGFDDLGWNDMGEGQAPAPSPAAPVPTLVPAEEAQAAPVPVPPVVQLQEQVREQIERPEPAEAPRAPRPVSPATAARIGRESAKQTRKSGKAAFTLRLDADHHLRLRLASATTGRSAQQLMIAALDDLLVSLPEVDTLVRQLTEAKRK